MTIMVRNAFTIISSSIIIAIMSMFFTPWPDRQGFSVGDSYSMGLYDGQHLAWKHEVPGAFAHLCFFGIRAVVVTGRVCDEHGPE